MDVSRKKLILIIISSCAGFLLLLALGLFLYFSAGFNVYHDDQYKFSIKYPSNWRMIVHPQANVAVVFLRPKDTAMDTLQENFNVTVQPLPSDIFTLDAFSAAIKRQMSGTFGKSINIVEDKPFQWGWHEGHIMVIEAPNPDHMKMINAWVLRDGQAYILTFLGDMNKYSQDDLAVSEMIRSLQLQ